MPETTSAQPVLAAPEIAEAEANVPRVDTSKIKTPERIQLRNETLKKLQALGSYVDKGPRKGYTGDVAQGRVIDIVIGLPAAGKSSVLVNPLSKANKARVIDSDMAKELLPEYNNGLGAGAVHEESKAIIDQLLMNALKNGDNIVYPIVGSNFDKLKDQIEEFKAEGYIVNLHLNELPSNKAIGRALNRYLEERRYIRSRILYEYGNAPTEDSNSLSKEDM